jgi:hypothetical protein
MNLRGESQSTWGKTCPSATLSTTNPTWTEPGSKLGLRVETPLTNRLSHGKTNLQLGNHLNIYIKDGKPRKPLSSWPVTGQSGYIDF